MGDFRLDFTDPVEETKRSVREESAVSAAREIEDSIQSEIAKETERIAAETDSPPPQIPNGARVYEINFGGGREDDMSDIWKAEEDTVTPRPRTTFDDLEYEFGPNYKNP